VPASAPSSIQYRGAFRRGRIRQTAGNIPKEFVMGQVSKNSRTSSTTHHFYCPCGGEVKMKTLFDDGRVKNVAECEKCKRTERRPSDFS